MYKDDNMMAHEGCSDALLKMIMDGRGNVSHSPTPIKCNQGDGTWGLDSYPLASVYAPLQSFGNLYDLDMALKQGTVFTELDLPFMGRRIDKGGKCCG